MRDARHGQKQLELPSAALPQGRNHASLGSDLFQRIEHAEGWTHRGIANRHIVQLAPQQTAQGVNARAGPGGNVGERAVLDFAIFTVGFAQQEGGRRVAIGDFSHIHADMIVSEIRNVKHNMTKYMTTSKSPKTIPLPDKSIISFQMQGGRSVRLLSSCNRIAEVATVSTMSQVPEADELGKHQLTHRQP